MKHGPSDPQTGAALRRMTVTSNCEIGPSLHLLRLRGGAAPRFESGQFVHVLPAAPTAALLPRPFSILRWEDNTLELLVRIVGRGTAVVGSASPGSQLSILGPLGRGYEPAVRSWALLVAGGVGVVPLVSLAQRLRGAGHSTVFLYGAATAAALALRWELASLGVDLALSTEDGSLGYPGDVVSLLGSIALPLQHKLGAPWVAACGPWPMLKSVWVAARGWSVQVQVSLETRMACGVGACLGCAVALAGDAGYEYVCTDGPVFDAAAVDWEQPPL